VTDVWQVLDFRGVTRCGAHYMVVFKGLCFSLVTKFHTLKDLIRPNNFRILIQSYRGFLKILSMLNSSRFLISQKSWSGWGNTLMVEKKC